MKKVILLSFLIFFVTGPINNLFAEQESGYNVLFIGNSLTSENNLPGMVEELAIARGRVLRINANTSDGCTLKKHALDQSLLKKITKGKWDFVILQEQSQITGLSQESLKKDVYPYAKKLIDDIRTDNPNAQVILYMTMARKNGDQDNLDVSDELGTYEGMQKRVIQSYNIMGQENQSIIAPIGEVWGYVRSTEPEMELYADYVHPNKTGAYLAACVLYKVMFHENTVGLPVLKGVTQQDADKIQKITDEMVSLVCSGNAGPEKIFKTSYECLDKDGKLRWQANTDIKEMGNDIFIIKEQGEGVYSGFESKISWVEEMEILSDEGIVRPLKSEKHIFDEKNKLIAVKMQEYDFKNNVVTCLQEWPGNGTKIKRQYKFTKDITNRLLLGLYIQKFIEKGGTRKKIQMISDEPAIYNIELIIEGKEKINVNGMERSAYKLCLDPNLGMFNIAKIFIPKAYVWHSSNPGFEWLRFKGLEGSISSPTVEINTLE
ncbi:MAG: DUF4886 domain-containing protein [Candidatus Omnitrophica bacterium]|nr:DUF4886 domain-containing protein [Candidatus Omnitrophota bacterium]